MYTKQIGIRIHGSLATLCGWGSVEYDDHSNDQIGNAEKSDILHCMHLTFGSLPTCKKNANFGDYRYKLICGWGMNPKQTSTLVIKSKNYVYFIRCTNKFPPSFIKN